MSDTFSTYDQVGKAEDVSDVISNISPFDTPLQTMIGRESVKARNPEYQEDALAAASTLIAPVKEGAAYADTARAATSMKSNYTEIRALAFSVSETSDAIKTHGRAKETAYQIAKAGKELKVAYEVRLNSHAAADSDAAAGVDAAVGDEDTNARESGNVWGEDVAGDDIVTNRSAATTSQVDFDETAFLAGMQVTYNAGAPGNCLMVAPAVSLMIKDWATLPAGRFRDSLGSKKLTMVVDILVTPFGTVKVMLNRHMGNAIAGTALAGDLANDAMLFDKSFWKIGVLRPWAKIKLAKTADADRYALRGEFTLMHKNAGEGYLWTNLDAPVAA